MIASATAIATKPTTSGSAAPTREPQAKKRITAATGSSRSSLRVTSSVVTVSMSRSSGVSPVTSARYWAPSGKVVSARRTTARSGTTSFSTLSAAATRSVTSASAVRRSADRRDESPVEPNQVTSRT